MEIHPSFAGLMNRLQAGDQDAAAEIFHRFANRLIQLARSRLNAQIRQKVDPEDVMQSVLKSFFHRQTEEAFVLGDWNNLWSLLVKITLRKCGGRVRYFKAVRRDMRRERPTHSLPDDSTASWQAIAREPTPSEAAILTETVQHLLSGLRERDRQIVSFRLQGAQNTEIARHVGCTERTVQRVLERLARRLRDSGENELGSCGRD
jgi:RNA polymerase sigma factor (sigma-70 family)